MGLEPRSVTPGGTDPSFLGHVFLREPAVWGPPPATTRRELNLFRARVQVQAWVCQQPLRGSGRTGPHAGGTLDLHHLEGRMCKYVRAQGEAKGDGNTGKVRSWEQAA